MTMRIVVMGVSGCGKSTVGKLLADELEAKFVDGDDLHPEENKAKMAAGIALNDGDRFGWLDKVGDTLASEGANVVACSALKKKYRDQIRAKAPSTVFLHLAGDKNTLLERMNSRTNHFMPASLLDSQLSALEQLEADELGMTLEINHSVSELVQASLEYLKQLN